MIYILGMVLLFLIVTTLVFINEVDDKLIEMRALLYGINGRLKAMDDEILAEVRKGNKDQQEIKTKLTNFRQLVEKNRKNNSESANYNMKLIMDALKQIESKSTAVEKRVYPIMIAKGGDDNVRRNNKRPIGRGTKTTTNNG